MSKGLKPSYYTYLFDLEDGSQMAFNAMSGAFVKISNDNYDSVYRILTKPQEFSARDENEKGLLESAIRGRFVVDEDLDEFQLLKFRSNVGRYSTELLHLTIMPTLDCNFVCPYCYENPEKGKMQQAEQDALCRWVDEKLISARVMEVAWFGGEPLLAVDVMRNLTSRFKEMCEDHSVEFKAGLTTNAFYLIPKIVDDLKDLGITFCQVTLDGPPEEHDRRRKLRNGKGSFKRIIDNLVYLCENTEEVFVTLRVNFDIDSFEKIPELFPHIPDAVRMKSQIYFRQVHPPPQWWDATAPTKVSSVPRNVTSIDTINLQKMAQDQGFMLFMISHTLKAGYCEADFLNHYVIDPKNNLHACTVAFDEEHRVGYITPEGQAVMNTPMMATWLMRESLDKGNCRWCKILPLCMGGCAFNTLCHKGKAVCSTVSDDRTIVENLRMLHRNLIVGESRKHLVKLPEGARRRKVGLIDG